MIALVTGATSGLGYAAARLLAVVKRGQRTNQEGAWQAVVNVSGVH